MLVEIAILHSHDVRQVRIQSNTVMFTCQIFAVLFFLLTNNVLIVKYAAKWLSTILAGTLH